MDKNGVSGLYHKLTNEDHKELVKGLRKAKKDLQNYEYEQNNK